MKGKRIAGAAAAGALAVALVIGLSTCGNAPLEESASPSPTPVQTLTHQGEHDGTAPPEPSAAEGTAPDPAGATPRRRQLDERYEALARKLRLTRPDGTAATELLAEYDRDELGLLAQVQKTTGKAPLAQLRVIIVDRRNGASNDALRKRADDLFADDLPTKLVVRTWLLSMAEQVTRDAPDARSQDGPSIRGRLRPTGRMLEDDGEADD